MFIKLIYLIRVRQAMPFTLEKRLKYNVLQTTKNLKTFVQFRLKPYLVTYFPDSLQSFD